MSARPWEGESLPLGAAARRERTPSSPCVGICLMDPAKGLCRGCLRTVAEIAAWYEADAAGKRDILARIAARRESAGAFRP
jgi:hypothetical protein